MSTDRQFLKEIQDANKSFTGWDFSFIAGTGRMQSGALTWSYGSMARFLVQQANAMLDMGTGGGEFLSMLTPFPHTVCATEGYKPNISIAKKQLEPLGVNVFPFEKDSKLPFEESQFDLILNQHESYSPKELKRIISEKGVFLTQQVGGTDSYQINEMFGAPLNTEIKEWNLKTALEEVRQENFKVKFFKEEFPIQRFFDIGALVYYLKAIPWQVPDFNIEKYSNELYEIHRIIQKTGYFETNQHRFIIKAKAY